MATLFYLFKFLEEGFCFLTQVVLGMFSSVKFV